MAPTRAVGQLLFSIVIKQGAEPNTTSQVKPEEKHKEGSRPRKYTSDRVLFTRRKQESNKERIG